MVRRPARGYIAGQAVTVGLSVRASGAQGNATFRGMEISTGPDSPFAEQSLRLNLPRRFDGLLDIRPSPYPLADTSLPPRLPSAPGLCQVSRGPQLRSNGLILP